MGLARVEGKQEVAGLKSGATYEIDAKGVREGREGFVIIECRRYTKSKMNQGKLGALAYRIQDTGAKGGIIVSPLGIQQGAAKIAAAENIISVRLDPNSTPTEFAFQFLKKVFVGLKWDATARASFSNEVVRNCEKCGRKFTVLENEKMCSECSHAVER